MKTNEQIHMRKGKIEDATSIVALYNEVYRGKYSDQNLTDYNLVSLELSSKNSLLFVASLGEKIVACLSMKYDSENEIVKASAAVVNPKFRGDNLTEKLIRSSLDYIKNKDKKVSLVYSTTRTVNAAAQTLTENLGFKKLGVFPNVHKTEDYETHTLTALINDSIFEKRHLDFELHPKLENLYNIVKKECSLTDLNVAKEWKQKVYSGDVPALEFINASNFVAERYKSLKESQEIDLGFFPFHIPNTLLISANSEIEIYFYINKVDMHCVITGIKIDKKVSFSALLKKMGHMLRDRGVRYIELIVRANRMNIIDRILESKFIPSGYIPGFQKDIRSEKRYDYVVFSRSFEILDFENLSFKGRNKEYVDEYVKFWMQAAFRNIEN